MPRDYEVWYASALEVMNTWLARGRALQIVTIRPDEFLVWLQERGLQNTAATRLRFVEDKARGGGGSDGWCRCRWTPARLGVCNASIITAES